MWTERDVEDFLADYWPGAKGRLFSLGQAFYVFLQAECHYTWAFEHYTKLHGFTRNDAALAYVRTAAVKAT